MEAEKIQYLANIYHVARTGGRVDRSEDSIVESKRLEPSLTEFATVKGARLSLTAE